MKCHLALAISIITIGTTVELHWLHQRTRRALRSQLTAARRVIDFLASRVVTLQCDACGVLIDIEHEHPSVSVHFASERAPFVLCAHCQAEHHE